MASFLTLTCSQRFSPLHEERALSLSLSLAGSLSSLALLRILEPELKLEEREQQIKRGREREGAKEGWRLGGQWGGVP